MDEKYSLDNICPSGSWIYVDGSTVFTPTVLKSILSNPSKKLEVFSTSGTLVKTMPELISLLEKNKGVCKIAKSGGDSLAFLWKDSFFTITYSKKNNSIAIEAFISDPKLIKVFEEIDKEFVSKINKNLVFSIIRNANGLSIKNLGNGSSPLIKENYNSSVLEDIEAVVKAFKKTPPPGRICILNGPPGTGKTHLIRSMFSELDCVFLITPSNLISSLDGPDFLPLLISIRDEHSKPIIMVIEDGDTCLVPRKTDNISTITSLLNLSDGILGSIIDIKMIISTNAVIDDLDPAVLRPGRLCKNIDVDPLDYEQANKVYQRLMNKKVYLERRKNYTLAEVYERFNNRDISISPPPAKNVIGFKTPAQNVVLNSDEMILKDSSK